MSPDLLVSRILDDERLTADLEGAEAELMIRWLVGRAERIARTASDESAARTAAEILSQRATLLGRLIGLLRTGDGATARAFAEAEGLSWPSRTDVAGAEMLTELLNRERC